MERNRKIDEIHWQGKPKFWSYDSYLGLVALLIIIPLGVMLLRAFSSDLGRPYAWRDIFDDFYTFASLFYPLACIIAGAVYLLWKRTVYTIQGDKLRIETGVWDCRITQIRIEDIKDIEIYQSPIFKKLNIANIQVFTSGVGEKSKIVIQGIPDYEKVFNLIEDIREKNRKR